MAGPSLLVAMGTQITSPMGFYAAALGHQRPMFCYTCISIEMTFSWNKFSCCMDAILCPLPWQGDPGRKLARRALEIMKRAAKGSNWTLPSGLEKSIDFWTVMS